MRESAGKSARSWTGRAGPGRAGRVLRAGRDHLVLGDPARAATGALAGPPEPVRHAARGLLRPCSQAGLQVIAGFLDGMRDVTAGYAASLARQGPAAGG